MPSTTILELSKAEQASLLRELRQARYGHLLAAHILLLRANGKNPTEIAEFLLCSRSSVYRTVKAYNAGRLDWQRDQDSAPSLGPLAKEISFFDSTTSEIVRLMSNALELCCSGLNHFCALRR